MKRKKLLTTIALVIVVIIAACKKDTYVETAGVCPQIVATDPVNLATGVPLNKIITATFNEIMNAATITPTSFTIETGAKGAALVPGTITYAGMTATFTPASPLTANTTYTGTIKSTVKDLKGNYMPSDYVWTFTTGSIPTVSSTSPVNNETGVLFNKVITAVFSEAMDPLTITTATVTLANGVTAVPGAVTFTGTTVSFTPTANLLPGTLYTATITTGAKNVPGIPLAANYVWKFTTATVPTVIVADPVNLAPNVALNKVVRATFSEVMDPSTITTGTTFTLLNGLIPVGGAVTYAGSIASFTPTVSLLAGTTYTAKVTTAAKNVAGIPMASDFVWSFTTIPAVYTLTVTAANGSVANSPTGLTYNSGTIVQLTATPAAGYSFTSWSGDIGGTLSPTTILMNGNKNVTANFTLISAVCPTIVPLGLSGNYVILSQSGISTTGVTAITGDMGISPMTSIGITGDWALNLPAGGVSSTSTRVTGNIYAPDYNPPTPANLNTAITDMTTAYTTANGVAPTVPDELGAGILSGNTLVAGVYKWGTGVTITTNITLDGGSDPCATFIFQIAGDLTVANGVIINLINVNPKNIFWVVAGSKAELGTTVNFKGNILCKTLISLNAGATVLGRLLSQTEVTLIASTVTLPL